MNRNYLRVIVLSLFLTNNIIAQVNINLSDSLSNTITQEGKINTNQSWQKLIPIENIGYWGILSDKFYFLLDNDKNPISNTQYNMVSGFKNGRAAVSINGKSGFIDYSGNQIIPITYDLVFDFNSLTTAVLKENKWSLIDTFGHLISNLDIDYFWGFENGIAKVTKDNNSAYIDTLGNLQGSGWSQTQKISFSERPNMPQNLAFCPANLDFENCDFTNWLCYTGTNRRGILNIDPTPTPPVSNRHTINPRSGNTDFYGGFPISAPDASSCAVRLGNPVNGAEAEQIEYNFFIPPGITDYTFMYQYALVFQDPGHDQAVQPRFRVQLSDVTSGQIVYCASVDYTAGYGGSTFFSVSPAGSSLSPVYYKPWTPVFINLGRYSNRQLKLTFTTMDCGLGGHWCYAYIDINRCGFSGLSANNSCSSPNTTTLHGPPGFLSYVWSTSPSLTNPLGNTQDVVVPPPGITANTTVYAQVIPDNGASCSDTLNVLVTPYTVKSSFPAQLPQCLRGNSFTFNSFSETNGGTISNFLWNFNDGGSTGSGATITHSFPRSDTFQVNLQVTTTEGCIDDTTIDIIILSSPQLRVNGTSICDGSSPLVTLTGGDTYEWNPRTGLTFTSPVKDSAFLGINNNTPYTIHVTDTTSSCYMDSIIQVIYYPNPNADFIQPASQCLRSNLFSFTNTSTFGGTGNVDYLWSFGDDGTSSQFSCVHSYDTAGTYTVILNATSPDGCRDTVEKRIVVNAHPSSNIFTTGSLRFCYKDSVVLNALGQAGSGSIASYQWYNNGSMINGGTQPSITIDTTSSIQLVIENTNGCKDTSLAQPIIAHPLPTGVISTNPASTSFICNGQNVEIKVNQSTATQYQWYYTDLAGSYAPRIILGADSSSIFVTEEGQYSLELTTSTIPACKGFAKDTIVMQVIKKPNPNFSFPNYCAGTSIPILNTSDVSHSGVTNYLWDFGDLSPRSNLVNPVHNYQIGTNYPVSLTLTPTLCPHLDSTLILYINIEEPVPSIRYPAVNAVKFTNTPLQSRTFADFYRWNTSVGLVNGTNNISNPIFNYDREVEYLINLKTNAGCKTVDTQLVRIFVVPDIQVPTAFSPNGDGHNDGLDVFTIGLEKLNFFRIFNRWGQLLYETTDPNKKWDGRYLTVKQPTESYVWIAEGVDQMGKVIRRRGQFILIR
jgi:gliding motility-associated-like protein